jgi:hypothetical protein
MKKYPDGHFIKYRPDEDGYLRATLCKNGKCKSYFVHRLVALTFIDNMRNLPQINHIDGNKQNNCVENLEWVNRSENIRHRINVLGVSLKNKKGSKTVLQYTINDEFVACYPSAKEAARSIKGSQGHISECCRGEKQHYRNFKWYYESNVGNDQP